MKKCNILFLSHMERVYIYIHRLIGNYCTAAEDKEEVKDVDEITCVPLWCR